MRRTISLTEPSRRTGTTSGSPDWAARTEAVTSAEAGLVSRLSPGIAISRACSRAGSRWKNPLSTWAGAGPSFWIERAGGGGAAVRSARSAAGCIGDDGDAPNSPRVLVNGDGAGAAGGGGGAGAAAWGAGAGAGAGAAGDGRGTSRPLAALGERLRSLVTRSSSICDTRRNVSRTPVPFVATASTHGTPFGL